MVRWDERAVAARRWVDVPEREVVRVEVGKRHFGVWLSGRAESGRTVRIVGDPYLNSAAEVWIDGVKAEVLGVERYRDGGTTVVKTVKGTVRWPSRLGREPEPPSLDGEELLPDLK